MRLAGHVLTAALITLAAALTIALGPAMTGRHPAPVTTPTGSITAAPAPSPVPFYGALPAYP